jgi:regulator of sigma E protease
MITGKQPSEKVLERAQMIGMLILLGLFVLATYNDLMKFVF